MKNVAVLLAGGSGKRMGSNLPKQFLTLGSKPIIQHSIEAFENHKQIDEICIVINADYHSEINELISLNKFSKVKHVLSGGKERSDSSLAAIDAYEREQNVYLIFHDAVRPFVSERIISDVIKELENDKTVAVAIPTSDTIFCLNVNDTIESVPPRQNLRRAQTPQAFKYSTIKQAYDIAIEDPNFIATDDCGVVLKYLPNEPIFIVDGDESNIKITFEQDLLHGSQILDGE
ncbi:2-C-methyl-D-erythritol 4-phosphate cytidylyltransferase [Marinifilum sp. N1E240]|uniref:2-C-methyl-D-erythritol 4-phosphate cytidylyltransferase n=1 Tax=Marinifilum sp. N1E240 TaxID=2608082 RepID=UPI00128CAF29|nr:2-C-methyl-D-erythritol 4-phosphate cytidylyltransferase [Marinifilum sp. N1E240]MPQ46507.1 2-C-methyl-D-erythritol 4-phosphate cytidylyltransferase [Marinifilum sp. N1E240]